LTFGIGGRTYGIGGPFEADQSAPKRTTAAPNDDANDVVANCLVLDPYTWIQVYAPSFLTQIRRI
jgi:hypothetical protein